MQYIEVRWIKWSRKKFIREQGISRHSTELGSKVTIVYDADGKPTVGIKHFWRISRRVK